MKTVKLTSDDVSQILYTLNECYINTQNAIEHDPRGEELYEGDLQLISHWVEHLEHVLGRTRSH